MGMTTQSTLRYPLEGDVIIGMIDTGIKEEKNPNSSQLAKIFT